MTSVTQKKCIKKTVVSWLLEIKLNYILFTVDSRGKVRYLYVHGLSALISGFKLATSTHVLSKLDFYSTQEKRQRKRRF